jgi:hypothetical protein
MAPDFRTNPKTSRTYLNASTFPLVKVCAHDKTCRKEVRTLTRYRYIDLKTHTKTSDVPRNFVPGGVSRN